MKQKVVIRCEGSGEVIDIPGATSKPKTKLLVYDFHGGDNQTWYFDESGRISSLLNSKLYLTVDDDNNVVTDTVRDDGRDKWILEENGLIRCLGIKDMVLTEKCCTLIMDKLKDEDPYQRWSLPPADDVPDASCPATSCHLRYPLPREVDTCTDWELKCSVTVRQTCPATYFMVVGWGPAGYSGIQEISECRRVAIFSMWNDCESKVEFVSKGEKAVVDPFGGEGTGLRTMMDLDWRVGENVTMVVSGFKDEDSWIVSCYIIYRDEKIFMSSYKRKGSRPLNRSGFYSFVEDWDRCKGTIGHLTCRKAEFSDPSISIKGTEVKLKKAVFTKVEHGRDKFACSKARGGVMQTDSAGSAVFFLSTGGDCSFAAEEQTQNNTEFDAVP